MLVALETRVNRNLDDLDRDWLIEKKLWEKILKHCTKGMKRNS